VTETEAAAHLVNYAEIDPRTEHLPPEPQAKYYLFVKHKRFAFWINDRELTVQDLVDFLASNQLLGRMSGYAANIAGSDAFWHQRRREVVAIFQQKDIWTIFWTVSYADNHLKDLHRLLPGGPVPPEERPHQSCRYPHLVDSYFSWKVDQFVDHFFKKALNAQHVWYLYEWQSRT
jgi:hypothetical protein